MQPMWTRPCALCLALGLAGRRLAQEKKHNLLVIGQSKGYQHEAVSPAMVTLYNLGRLRAVGTRISGPIARPSPRSPSRWGARI